MFVHSLYKLTISMLNLLNLNLSDNSKTILNLIRLRKEISAADIAKTVTLQPSTVAYILKSLHDTELIKISKTGDSTSKGGKKPLLWSINPDYGYFTGIEVMRSSIRLVITNLSGEILIKYDESIDMDFTGDTLILFLNNAIRDAVKRIKYNYARLMGVGIALPGIVDEIEGKIHISTKLNIQNFPFTNEIEKLTEKPVAIVNDANAGALGFKWYASDSQQSNLPILYITYNNDNDDLGTGLIIHGQLYSGANGMAGEVIDKLPNIQEFQIHHKDKNIENDAFLKKLKRKGNCNFDEILQSIPQSAFAEKYIKAFNQVIIDEFARLISFIDPSVIYVGGDLSSEAYIQTFIIPKVQKKLQNHFNFNYRLPKIIVSPFGKYDICMGAASLFIHEFYQ